MDIDWAELVDLAHFAELNGRGVTVTFWAHQEQKYGFTQDGEIKPEFAIHAGYLKYQPELLIDFAPSLAKAKEVAERTLREWAEKYDE